MEERSIQLPLQRPQPIIPQPMGSNQEYLMGLLGGGGEKQKTMEPGEEQTTKEREKDSSHEKKKEENIMRIGCWNIRRGLLR